MPYIVLWGFIDSLLEAFNWEKLLVPFFGGGILIPLTFYIAFKIAKRGVAQEIAELKSKLISETESHAADRTTIETLKIQQAAHSANLFAQLTTIEKATIDIEKDDIVLLDCPPVLNISCANAFAASDYLLIPTLLSTKSIERVPNLIKAVQEDHFLHNLNSKLKVLGVVANRTRSIEIKGQEAINWSTNLPGSLAAIQNQHTRLFSTVIAQDVEISSSEEIYTPPKVGGRAHLMFTQLLIELEEELPDVCRRFTKATS